VLRCVTTTMGPVFLAVRKPELTTVGQVIRFVILAVSILPLTFYWGILGTSLSVLLCALASLMFFGRMVRRILNINISAYIKSVLPSLAGGFALILVLTYLQTHFVVYQIDQLFLSVSLGGAVYIGAILLCEAAWDCGCLETVRSVIGVWR
jgi:O-antigen/teichoic acid export membrane protein